MRLRHGLLLLAFALTGCATTSHGPATSTVVERGQTRYVVAGGDTVNRQRIQESRLRDEQGREWTESRIVAEEPVALSELEAEMFRSLQKQQEP